MADTKISALTAATTLPDTTNFAIDEAGVSKRITAAVLRDLLGVVKARLSSDHAISSTTATEVALGATLGIGTWVFKYTLLIQSATVTVSPLYGINFTGTAAVRSFGMRYWDAGPLTAGTAVADNTNAATTAQGPLSGQIHNAFTTTVPLLQHSGGVAATASDILVIIEGILIATVAGDLELWHGSETATSTTIKAGSSLVVTRTSA